MNLLWTTYLYYIVTGSPLFRTIKVYSNVIETCSVANAFNGRAFVLEENVATGMMRLRPLTCK